MELSPKIRRAGVGRRPCARRLTATLAILLAFALHLIAPPAVEAASNGGVGGSKGSSAASAPAQPSRFAQTPRPTRGSIQKQPCGVLLSAHLGGASPNRGCQEPSGGSSEKAVPVVDLNPAHVAEDAVGAAGDVVDSVTGAAADAVTGTILDGFKAIIGFLFGGLQSAITVALIKWIATVPNLSDGHVGQLEANIAVGAAGLLAATMTISIVRFWGSGLTGDGAWAGAEGVARAAVAATLIGLWPQIFDLAVRLSNALQHGILDEAVQAQLKALFRDLDVIGLGGGAAVGLASGVISGGLVPLFLAIVIAIVGMLMLLALVAMKIVITALTIVLFCAMPLALVLWPIPELSGLVKICARSLGVALAIPVIWCLVFGAFAAIGADTFSFHNTGKDEDFFGTALNVTIVRPLVAISLLYLALVLPRRLLQMAPMMGGGRAGFGRALATGATLRAGFHYGPQAGRMALDKAQTVAAARFGKGAAGGGKVNAAATQPGGASSKDAGKGGPKSPASSLRDSSAQAPKPGQARPGNGSGSANEMGESPAAAAHNAKARAAMGKGPMAANGTGPLKLAGGEFGGPETQAMSDAKKNEIDHRQAEMGPRSKSGKAVSHAQVDGAISGLQSQPEFVQAARRAALHKDSELATGAFAEWSLSDNAAVTDTHRDAFNILGQASPSQRQSAFTRFDGSGEGGGGNGGGSGGSAKGGKRGSSESAEPNGGRRVPVRDQSASPPPPPRAMPRQPGQNGGS